MLNPMQNPNSFDQQILIERHRERLMLDLAPDKRRGSWKVTVLLVLFTVMVVSAILLAILLLGTH